MCSQLCRQELKLPDWHLEICMKAAVIQLQQRIGWTPNLRLWIFLFRNISASSSFRGNIFLSMFLKIWYWEEFINKRVRKFPALSESGTASYCVIWWLSIPYAFYYLLIKCCLGSKPLFKSHIPASSASAGEQAQYISLFCCLFVFCLWGLCGYHAVTLRVNTHSETWVLQPQLDINF